MYRKILVPLSNAAFGMNAALDAANHIGRIFGSQVEVLYARHPAGLRRPDVG